MSRAKPSIADLQDRERQRWREQTARRSLRLSEEHTAQRLDRIAKRHAALLYDGPRMLAGDGDRREDCARYGACLDRFVAAFCQRGDRPGHCPEGCSGYARSVVEAPVPVSNLGVVHGANA